MASIFVMSTDPPSEIDYSLVDGRVRAFVLRGQILFDEYLGMETPEWKEKLVAFVKEQGLDVDQYEQGLHAFIYKLQEEGLLE